MRLENLVTRLGKQIRMHAVNAALLMTAISLLLFWQVKPSGLVPPQWLLGFELHLSTILVLLLLGTILLRFNRGIKALQRDWLAVQPIALAQRMNWLRATIAARSALELIAYCVLAASVSGVDYGFGVLIFGAGLSLITLILLPYWQIVAHARIARHAVSPQGDNVRANAATHKTAVNTDPFNAWFTSAIPRLSKLRWWWLIPLLSLPMGSKIMLIAAVFAGFLSVSRFAAICGANSIALADISELTLTTALKPRLLYRAALIFSAQGALILALVAIAIALSPAGFGIAVIVAIAGLLQLMTALHFGFGCRLEPKACALRRRASLLIALLLGITANSLPMLLPIVCALLWFWLFRRGCRVTKHLGSI